MKTQFPIFNGPSTTPHKQNEKPFITVRNQGGSDGPVEILINGQIGKSYWDDSGISEKEFTDALNAIPKNKEVIIGINSEGGSVQDGLGIYNAIKRRDKTTARIDGYAVSIASVIPLAAKRVISPKSSIWMIHDPWSVTQGTADDHRKAADMLDTHAEVIVSAYVEKTGKNKDEIRAAMKSETWMSGAEASAFGLSDETSEDEVVLNTIDLSSFRRVPGAIAQMHNSAVLNGGANQNQKNTMNRDKIVALLKKHGATVDNAATDEQLLAQLETVVNKLAEKPAPNDAATATAQLATITADIENLKKVRNDERKAFVGQKIDSLINEGKVAANEKDFYVMAAMTDDKVIDMLAKREVQKPGGEPVRNHIDIKADASISDVEKHLGRLTNEATASMLRGNSVSPKIIAANAHQAAVFYNQHRNRILPILNANTISADLKRNTILQEIMRAFGEHLMPLRAFSTVFENVPLLGTDKVAVPYYPLETAASTDWNGVNGYVMGDTTINDKDVTIDKRKYQPIRFGSDELNRQPAINLLQVATIKAEKLAADVFANVLSVVTLANYGAASFTGVASTFDSSDIADLKGVCDTAEWPTTGRSLVIGSAYDVNLLKDSTVKSALNFGSADPIQNGTIRKILGFDYYTNTNIPANAENLVGMCVYPSAILVATAPVMPDESVRGQLLSYQVVVHPQLGIAFEYRRWGNADFDQRREVIEVNYGFNVGEAAALKRLVSV